MMTDLENPVGDETKVNSRNAIRSKEMFKTSLRVSKREVTESFKEMIKDRQTGQVLFFLRDLIGSGAWVGNTGLKHLKTVTGLDKKISGNNDDVYAQMIVTSIANKKTLDKNRYSKEEVFKAIYKELEFSHWTPQYQSLLRFKPLKATIVLVSGVLNEVYKTAAFESGVMHLSKKYGQKYFVAKVKGLKGSKHNAKLIEKQLKKYIDDNPKEKLWIIAYSKGGIDSLHFLRNNSEFANRHIIGLSTIASPIMGSKHIDEHKGLKFLNSIHQFSHTKIYKYLLKKYDFLAKDLQQSLSATHQEKWLKRNYSKMPKKPFYTALGLEANFIESHIGMMFTKLIFSTEQGNDGVVEADRAFFPDYFKSHNLGLIRGHHLIGARSSTYLQEALIETHALFLDYYKLIPMENSKPSSTATNTLH